MNAFGEVQEMALAGTPDSISLRLVQLTPELLAKNSVPLPPVGEVKVKCVPTGVQVPPHTGSLMMILGSGTELAKAAALVNTDASTSKMRQNFINSPNGLEKLRRVPNPTRKAKRARLTRDSAEAKYLLRREKVKRELSFRDSFLRAQNRFLQPMTH
jgi:hypothetical protein